MSLGRRPPIRNPDTPQMELEMALKMKILVCGTCQLGTLKAEDMLRTQHRESERARLVSGCGGCVVLLLCCL